jgi:ParB/Sulfiredoxin domain
MAQTTLIHPADVTPWHDVEDADKVSRLSASMQKDGWTGAPVVVIDGGQAVTGSHRIAAALKADIEIPTVNIRDLFADAGLDYDDTVAVEYDGYWYEVIVRADQFLPADLVDEYGLDAH